MAYDSVIPDNQATTDVTITVIRNPAAPVFSPSADYNRNVNENATIGSLMVDVNATDQDGVCTAVVVSVLWMILIW